MKPENPPAFPIVKTNTCHETGESFIDLSNKGMSLRDYFAAKAMQSIIQARLLNPCKDDFQIGPAPGNKNNLVATCAYAVADEMLLERSKTNE